MVNTILELHRLLRNRYLPQEDLRALQENKLRAVIKHAYDNVPYYPTLFRSAGITPQDVRTLEDLLRVPITSKEALRAAGVQGALAQGVDPSSLRAQPHRRKHGQAFCLLSRCSRGDNAHHGWLSGAAHRWSSALGPTGHHAHKLSAAQLDEPPWPVPELSRLPLPFRGRAGAATEKDSAHRAENRPQQAEGYSSSC